jgi:hypothetical protein
MRSTLQILILLIPIIARLVSAQSQVSLDCPDDSNLTLYLTSLIDVLYENGLTTYEALLAAISATDSGYALLETWYSIPTFTLFPPTDQGFQTAGILPPFIGYSEEELTNLVALHAVSQAWAYQALPQAPMHAIGTTQLSMTASVNSTVDSQAWQVMVMEQGSGASVLGKMAVGNATSWSGPVDLSQTQLANLVILRIDTVSRRYQKRSLLIDRLI